MFLTCGLLHAQDSLRRKEEPPYNRREEIIVYGKRYRLHNNYLTLGGGFLASSIRSQSQRMIGIDFQFHVRREHFQVGMMMSGDAFLSNNHAQGHLGYGKRWESRDNNIAVFAGAAYHTGVRAVNDTLLGTRPEFYQGFGAYICLQGIKKFTYDFGGGVELYGEINQSQSMLGFKVILFFSGAYRGPKRNYNPNVRSENPG